VSPGRRLLIVGGIALALLGMLYGLHYAVFVEHQMLGDMGRSLTSAFVHAAGKDWKQSETALLAYRETKYKYIRQVDLHSHWIGLAMLMIVLGIVFDEVSFGERSRFAIALALLAGSVVFPLGVLLQTVRMVSLGSALAIAGSAMVITALAATAVGFFRSGST
jgi:hypothetical protein